MWWTRPCIQNEWAWRVDSVTGISEYILAATNVAQMIEVCAVIKFLALRLAFRLRCERHRIELGVRSTFL